MKKISAKIWFVVVFVVASYLRFSNLNWDAGQHLHPDERFLTMVTNDVSIPKTWQEYFSTSTSPFNPHNQNYGFYVYGTLPVLVTKFLAVQSNMDSYEKITLLGRFLSACLDMRILVLVYKILLRITKKQYIALWGMTFYTFIPMTIQLAHFYTTDTWMSFFITLSVYMVTLIVTNKAFSFKKNLIFFGLLGVCFGLAAASKISSLLYVPVIVLPILWDVWSKKKIPLKEKMYRLLLGFGCTLLVFLGVFRTAQPYLFVGPGFFNITLNQKVLDNWQQLKSWENPDNAPPFAFQWIPTQKYIYPAENLFFWGLGIPVGTLFFLSLVRILFLLIKKMKLRKSDIKQLNLPLFWVLLAGIVIVFIYQGGQFAKVLRYYYPIISWISVILAIVYGKWYSHSENKKKKLVIFFVWLGVVWWGLSFFTIYLRPHTRVQASTWIYSHLPAGTILTTEIWDDGLPLTLGSRIPQEYSLVPLAMYDPDSRGKWQKLSEQFVSADYVILSSNRLWRSISSLPKKYPTTSQFYQKILKGDLGYEVVATFTSYPCLVPKSKLFFIFQGLNQKDATTDVTPPVFDWTHTQECSVALNDDGSEESFTVYDHPKVIILRNLHQQDEKSFYEKVVE